MIGIAAALLLLVLVFTIAVAVSNPEIFDLSVFGARISVNTAGVYFTGAGAMLMLIFAAVLMLRGIKREKARRAEVRALRSAAGARAIPKPMEKTPPPTNVPTKQTRASEAPPSGAHPKREEPDSTSEPRHRASTLDLDSEPESTTAPERRALMEEAEKLTGDADR